MQLPVHTIVVALATMHANIHLQFYIYKTCVERAIRAMSDGVRGAVDFAHAHVWVPYLVERGREREILAILAPVGALPERVAADMVSLLWRSGADQEVIDELIDGRAVRRQASQPRTLHVLAAHCVGAGDYATAVALGTRSFDEQTTVQTAQLVANAETAPNSRYPDVSSKSSSTTMGPCPSSWRRGNAGLPARTTRRTTCW